MERLRARLQLSFSNKVLLPMVTILVLLLGMTVWTVNRRLMQQFQMEASHSLLKADAECHVAQKSRVRNLAQRLRALRNEPRYKAVIQSGHPLTIANAIEDLQDLPADQSVDVALFSSAKGEILARVQGDPKINLSDFESKSLPAVQRALGNKEAIDTIHAGNQLFDVVSIPVSDSS